MPHDSKRHLIFISATEPSADNHCAGLIRAIRQKRRDIDFAGVGGTKMAEAGCHLIENIAGQAAMSYNAFSHIGYYYRLIRRIAQFLTTSKVALVIVCDSPAFNFHVARHAKKLGIKTLFYVAPQLWAWAPWRIGKLRKYCDKLCCILPFEQDWFSARGAPAEFVGNPLLDELTTSDITGAKRDYANFNPSKAKIAIIPGSRKAEVGTLWKPMQQIAVALRKKYPNITFTTVAVDDATRGALDSTRLMNFRTSYKIDAVYDTARECDFSLVASGSATLQVASAGCPMVVMYKTNPFLWHLLGRWLITTKYLSLVNILANEQRAEDGGQKTEGRADFRHPSSVIRLPVVPEFMPYFKSIEPVVKTIDMLFADKSILAQINTEMLALVRPLMTKKAGVEVAQTAISMLPEL